MKYFEVEINLASFKRTVPAKDEADATEQVLKLFIQEDICELAMRDISVNEMN